MRVLKDHWYPVLESHEVGDKPRGVERFGQRLVFWRSTDHNPHAHIDRCPHLGARISQGKICSDRIVCPFHGFEFNTHGECLHIPANGKTGKIPKGMELQSFKLEEQHGFIWLWWGASRKTYPELPFFSQLEKGWRFGSVVVEWPVHYSRAIENQLDVAHLPFVHANTIGRGKRTVVEGPHVESNQQGIKVWVTNIRDEASIQRNRSELSKAAEGKEPGLRFLFPGVWLLNINPRIKNLLVFVPVNEHKTRYYLRVYHQIWFPPFSKLFEWVMGISNRFILQQDKRVVVTQTPTSSSEASADRLIGADIAISEFRRIHRMLLEKNDSSDNTE
jgi:phenylpropionate dioxygenase-like ring-hydroxylating dioxygenase large terminal subunit